MSGIDWSRPCYRARPTSASARTANGLTRCDLCGGKIELFEPIVRGPRNLRVAHVACLPPVAALMSGES